MTTHAKKALDWWARGYGYSDYDTYIRAGGSIDEAATNMRQRINTLLDALHAITGKPPLVGREYGETSSREPPGNSHPEPPDPENAQIQGAELG